MREDWHKMRKLEIDLEAKRNQVAELKQAIADKDQQIDALQLRLDIVTAAYQRFAHLDQPLTNMTAAEDPIYQTAAALWGAVKQASEVKP